MYFAYHAKQEADLALALFPHGERFIHTKLPNVDSYTPIGRKEENCYTFRYPKRLNWTFELMQVLPPFLIILYVKGISFAFIQNSFTSKINLGYFTALWSRHQNRSTILSKTNNWICFSGYSSYIWKALLPRWGRNGSMIWFQTGKQKSNSLLTIMQNDVHVTRPGEQKEW